MVRSHTQRADLAIDCRNALGETPVWDSQSGTLYWIDVIRPGRIYHWSSDSTAADFWEFDALVTGVDLIAGGGLLVRTGREVLEFDTTSGSVSPIFQLPQSESDMRFNDGHCDEAGRLWLGTMQNNIAEDGPPMELSERNGCIYVIGTDGPVRQSEAQFGCPNALCWSPDGRTFYIADSCDGWLYAYACDMSTAELSRRRSLFHQDGLGIPDGAAVDRDGFIWNARWGAGVVARISPEGILERVVQIPASQVTACCFGGPGLHTLFVTSARYGLDESTLREEPLAGGVFSVPVDVPGLNLPVFQRQGSIT